MLDHTQAQAPRTSQMETYALVVIGAGIAGLNALTAACEYLPKGARVLLLDQKHAPGGMWNTAYDYVRLHQPHPMFTVGDLKWDWRKPRDYLAARDEVQTHLSRSLAPIGQKVALSAVFEQTVVACVEVDTDQGPMAEVTFHPNETPAQTTTIRATRAIHAAGLNYAPACPLALSSKNVVSIIPQDLRSTLADNPGAPVIVAGGGKTGMDTILAILAADPNRQITLIKGRGTIFLNRTKYLPTGLDRWTSGELVSRLFRDWAVHFDGQNEDDMLAYIRDQHSTDAGSGHEVFLYALQSEDELARIKAGLTQNIADYLEGITDTPDGVQMTLRSGAKQRIPDGTIVVNCTGSFFRDTPEQNPMPILSPKDCILRINARDGFHFLTSVAAFFTTHLLYRDQLRGQGFYTLDLEAVFRKNRNAWVGASATQAYLNQVIALQTLPLRVLDRCGLDMDRWYPLPRRLAALVRLKSTATRDMAHCRRALDQIAQRFDMHAGPLD